MEVKYRLVKGTVSGQKFYRSLSPSYPQMDWHTTEKDTYGIKCHWGQRKLMFSEIEFLTIVSKHYKLENCLVVYVGSANGVHLNVFTETLFPQVHWLLYDPAPFRIKESNRVTIKTGKNGYFTNDKVQEVLQIAAGRDILFVSDIRMSTDDVAVTEDMLAQQRWAIMMGAKAIMLKLRFPFVHDAPGGARMLDPAIHDKLDYSARDPLTQDKVTYDGPKPTTTQMVYLDGQVQLQLYAPTYSSETRLISMAKDGKYPMRLYDAYKYESQLLYFNQVDRVSKTFKYRDSPKLKEHLLGYDDGYESVAEYVLASEYLVSVGKEPTLDNIVQMLYMVDHRLRQLTQRTLLDCNHITNAKAKKEAIKYRKSFLRNMDAQRKLLESSMVTQAELFEKRVKGLPGVSPNLLTKEQYAEQLAVLRAALCAKQAS
jgi:hypothetical protein